MRPSSLTIAAFVSVTVHAAAFANLAFPWAPKRAPETILVSIVDFSVPEPKAIAYPRQPKKTAAQAEKSSKAPTSPAKSPPKDPGGLLAVSLAKKEIKPAPAKPSPPPVPDEPRSSAELLRDPKNGRVFYNYFTMVRERIQSTVRDKYSEKEEGTGAVALLFVLRADGTLERVNVIDDQTDAPSPLKNFARECVRETAPFVGFPQDLAVERISFNLTILFDEP